MKAMKNLLNEPSGFLEEFVKQFQSQHTVAYLPGLGKKRLQFLRENIEILYFKIIFKLLDKG